MLEATRLELTYGATPALRGVSLSLAAGQRIALMGPSDPSIRIEKTGPTILMLCGLQGAGKTTTCGKLAKLLATQGRKPLLVAADLQRPAAVEQLKVIGQQLQIPVYAGEPGAKKAGRFRLEGKEYAVQDGDVLHFRFGP